MLHTPANRSGCILNEANVKIQAGKQEHGDKHPESQLCLRLYVTKLFSLLCCDNSVIPARVTFTDNSSLKQYIYVARRCLQTGIWQHSPGFISKLLPQKHPHVRHRWSFQLNINFLKISTSLSYRF